MSGDMANAELGIAETDAIGAKGRLANQDGLSQQAEWNQHYLGERTLGFAILLGIALVLIVWITEVSTLVTYGVTALVALIAIGAVIATKKRQSALQLLREQQVQQHNAS